MSAGFGIFCCILILVERQASSFRPLRSGNYALRSLHSSYDQSGSSLYMASRDFYSADLTKTTIETPTLNSRKITASIIVNSPIEDVWAIITDYNQLAVHVPNLVQSYVIPIETPTVNSRKIIPVTSINGKPNLNVRIFQEGAQKIVGFNFKASLTMDMKEDEESEGSAMKEKRLLFKLAESGMFSSFDGSWSMKYHSRVKEVDPSTNAIVYKYKTMLTYTVLVKPKGPVPVIALEWRIKEDVPVNLLAVKAAAELLTVKTNPVQITKVPQLEMLRTEWGADETLGMYLGIKKDTKATPSAPYWVPRTAQVSQISTTVSKKANTISDPSIVKENKSIFGNPFVTR